MIGITPRPSYSAVRYLSPQPLSIGCLSARCSLSLCPPQRRSLHSSLSPRLTSLQLYLFISILGACSLSGHLMTSSNDSVYGVRDLDGAIALQNRLYPDPQQCLVRPYRAPSISSLTFGNTGGICLVSRPAKWSSPLRC